MAVKCRTYGGRAFFKVVSRFVSKIMFKKAIVAAHKALFGHEGI